MTGGGSADISFVKEVSFDTLPADPTYYVPGRNPTVQNASLDRQLQRLREAGLEEAAESLAGNLEGAFSVNYAMNDNTHQHVRDIVFNDGGTGFTSGHATTSSWYIGIEYLDSISTTATAERHLKACIPLSYQITYQQGTNTVNETLTMGYADEETNASITPGTTTGPNLDGTTAFHGTELQIDSNVQTKLQSATLSIDNISRFMRGTGATAVDAVLAAPETTLETTAIFDTTERLELAYGSSGATSPEDRMDAVSGHLDFEVSGSRVAQYDFSRLKPANYDWTDLVNPDNDLTDPVTWHVNGGIGITTT